jgi:hypothetical protein
MKDHWEKLEKYLDDINHNFVQISKQHYSISEHLSIFNNLFIEKTEVHGLNKLDTPPIVCIVPVFHILENWNTWSHEIFDELQYFGCIDKDFINQTSSIQGAISDYTKPFTKTVLESKRDTRTLIVITLHENGNDLEYSERHGSRVQVFSVLSSKHKKLIEKYKLPTFKYSEDYECAKLDYKNRSTGIKFENKDFEITPCKKNDAVFYFDFAKEMAIPVLHHSLYVSENYDLYFCFSNVVADYDNEVKLGLGGIFVLANKHMLKDHPEREKKFITIFGKLSDALAIRVINYFQMEENLKQASRAAISQVMARNMSHNIGSHVIPHMIRTEYPKIEIEKYNRYIQERMELIATVSTTFPFYLKTETTICEILESLKDNEIIMKGIVDGSLKIEFKYENTSPLFHLPGGQIGKHLMFSFIEGIIRNCKKHSIPENINGTKKISLNFKISESDQSKDYYCLDIIDNLGSSNPNRNSSTLEIIRKHLFDSILENNALRKEGWGILELKIAAALLIGYPLEELDLFDNSLGSVKLNKKVYPLLINVGFYDNNFNRVKNNDSNNKNIGYRIYVLKPKLFYFDSVDNQNNPKQIKDDYIIRTKDFSLNETCDFYLGCSRSPFSNYRKISDFDSCSEYTGEAFIKCVWEKWISENYKLSTDKLNIVDENTSEENFNSMILYDNHCGWLKKMISNDSNYFNNFNPLFYQPYNTKSSLGNVLKQLDEIQILKLKESIGVGVSVFDERIQADVKDRNHENISIKLIDILCKMGVYIPKYSNYEEPNNLQKFIDSKTDGYTFENHPILCEIKERFKSDKYVLLHHTIFEIISSQLNNGSKSYPCLNQLYKKIYSEFNLIDKQLVVISGLGLPSNLPENCYFLNLVTVQNLLLVMKSKYHLVQTLQALRPITNKNN